MKMLLTRDNCSEVDQMAAQLLILAATCSKDVQEAAEEMDGYIERGEDPEAATRLWESIDTLHGDLLDAANHLRLASKVLGHALDDTEVAG